MKLSVGDYLYVTDEALEGRVVRFTKNKVTLLCPDGFEYEYFIHQVFKKVDDDKIEHLHRYSPPIINNTLENYSKKKELTPLAIEVKSNRQVFDLHMEELAPQLTFTGAHEILLFQLNFVRNVIYSANRNRIRRLIFIHGIGQGRLKMELRKMISEEFKNVEFFDGSYQQFGQGATEINIRKFVQVE